jgi:YgiT-type zinc finger domain-containing protein
MRAKKTQLSTCDYCGSKTEIVFITKLHRRGGETYRIENVETEQCTKCGTRYFSAGVLFALDREIDSKKLGVTLGDS